MFEWLATLQFGAPLSLAAAALAPLLIYTYLRKNPQRERRVSSVMILKLLPKRQPVRRRFRPPLRFFLELLAILLLCLAAAAPSRKQPDERVAVVIDNSLSMQAIDNAAGLADTRLHQAITAAVLRLSEFSSSTRFTVFTSSPKLSRVGEEDLSEKSAASAIKNVTATWAGDTLETGVSELASSNDYDRVIAVSDRKADFETASGDLEASGSMEKSGAGLSKRITRIEALQVGTRTANIYLSNLAVIRSGISEGGGKLTVSVGYSGPGTQNAMVSFSELQGGRERGLGDISVTLHSDRGAEASINLPSESAVGTIYRAKVVSANSSEPSSGDAIQADNSMWMSSSSEAQGKLLLVDAQSQTALGLNNIPGLSVETINPKNFSEAGEADLEKYSLLIFHGTAPTQAPKRPTLLILPPLNNPIFPGLREENDAKLSSWSTDHPLTSYLRVQLFRFSHVMLFDTPLWATSVMNVERGSVVVAGESRGVRFAAVGFELLPFEGGKTPTLSILTLNLLNWLSGSSDIGAGNLTGGMIRLEPGTWNVRLPSGETVEVVSQAAEPAHFLFSEPGVYRIDRADGTSANNNLGRVLTVNAVHPDESATYISSSFQSIRQVEHEEATEKGMSILWPFVIGGALLFMLLEMLLRFRPERAAA